MERLIPESLESKVEKEQDSFANPTRIEFRIDDIVSQLIPLEAGNCSSCGGCGGCSH